MIARPALLAALALAALAGCAGPEQRPSVNEIAIDTGRARARTQWNCNDVAGKVLSRTPLDMAASYAGPERYQYTVALEGCGKAMNALVICAAGTPCYVAGTDRK